MIEPYPLIAIVDDEKSVRCALLRLLRSADMNGRAFSSGAEFFDFVQTCKPKCVLLDLHLPKVNGFEIQSRLAQYEPDIPIIVMTGQDSVETHRRAMLHGPLAYLLKPIDDQALLEAITRGLQRGVTQA